MNNKSELYAEGVNLRLRQVGMSALAIAERKKIRLAVIPGGDPSTIGFFVRTPKPDYTTPMIGEILAEAVKPYSVFVKVEANKISLVNEKKKPAPAPATTPAPTEVAPEVASTDAPTGKPKKADKKNDKEEAE